MVKNVFFDKKIVFFFKLKKNYITKLNLKKI